MEISRTIFAKDSIGEAQENAAVEEARMLLESMGIVFYNLALTELYNIISYIEKETYYFFETPATVTTTDKTISIDLATLQYSFNKIEGMELNVESVDLECYPVGLAEYLRAKRLGGAPHPYQNSAIYTEIASVLEMVIGKDIPDIVDTPNLKLYYNRQPILLTTSNYDTAKIDVPDKYYSLLVARITSYAELRQGITDKALATVKSSYEQVLLNADASYRSSIMNSLKYRDTYTPPDERPQVRR